MNSQVILDISLIIASTILFVLWSYERHKTRDYATELSNLIHEYGLDSRDLRRSLRYKEIRNQVEKNYE